MARCSEAVTSSPLAILRLVWFSSSLLQYCYAGTASDKRTSYELDKKPHIAGPTVHVEIKPRHRRQPTETVYNETIIDNHNYYTSRYVSSSSEGNTLWVNLDNPLIAKNVEVPEILATSSRQGKQVQLGFSFLFYGHEINSVIITTGGFIYTGSHIHRYLAATQYIAPLMGNFIPSASETAGVRFYDNGTALTVEWREQNIGDNIPAGLFTFQATLFQDGRIVFAYKQIAVPVSRISEEDHPVKVGIADAYYIDTFVAPFSKKREIFEYHRVGFNINRVANGTAILLLPLPMLMAAMLPKLPAESSAESLACIQLKSCESCTTSNLGFNCTWCESFSTAKKSVSGRCSDGLDRNRQAWLNSGCNTSGKFVDAVTKCPGYIATTTEAPPPPPTKTTPTVIVPDNDFTPTETPKQQQQQQQTTADYCKDIKCLHGGMCEEGFCNCPPQFEGARCQKYVTGKCENIACKNGGKCEAGITTQICDCKPGFSGKFCEVVNSPAKRRGLTAGGTACIVLITMLIVGLFTWAVYAYRHPASPSGLFILEAKHRLKCRSRGSNGVKYKYHQQVDTNQVDIQL